MAKANNVELEVVETNPAKGVSEEYRKINPLGKIPTFVGADGYVLHEAIAIAIYSKLTMQNFPLPHDVPHHAKNVLWWKKLSTVIPVLINYVDLFIKLDSENIHLPLIYLFFHDNELCN